MKSMNKNLSKLFAAAILYAGFAVYLYQPYFKNFDKQQYLLLVNVCAASLGCFVLSRRWVGAFGASFFAGALYGFSPFMLGLGKYHPTAGFLAAIIPWLFCPAAYGPRSKLRWVRIPLAALPFLVIVLFFKVAACYGLFPIPIQTRLQLADLAGLAAPLVAAKRNLTLIGFYHVPVAALVIGFSIMLAARRVGVIFIFCIGTIPAFCGPLLNTSPLIWLSVPMLCCSILIGEGLQGFVSAGFGDRKWLLGATAIMVALAVCTLLLATKYYKLIAGLGAGYADVLVQTARMYILGAIAAGIVLFIVSARLRCRRLRWAVLYSAMTVDIFFGATFIVDKIL